MTDSVIDLLGTPSLLASTLSTPALIHDYRPMPICLCLSLFPPSTSLESHSHTTFAAFLTFCQRIHLFDANCDERNSILVASLLCRASDLACRPLSTRVYCSLSFYRLSNMQR
jgi:hypothetical protein